MKKIAVELKNCYGIKKLEYQFDFSKAQAYAIYAPNGVMKSSMAETFQDAMNGKESEDRIFPKRKSLRNIVDENANGIKSSQILVVPPYDEKLGVSEKTSTLLLNQNLKNEYDALLRDTAAARDALLTAISKQAGTKKSIATEISSAIMHSGTEIESALMRLQREVESQKEPIFANVPYEIVFNDKVQTALNTKDLKSSISEYVERYNQLLNASTYFRKGTFDYYNAAQIAKSLSDNGFFDARHSIKLNADVGNTEIKNEKELSSIIEKEKETILKDQALSKKFDDVSKQLQKNAELRAFAEYIQNEPAILSRIGNLEKLKQDVIISYIKANEMLYKDWIEKFDKATARREELKVQAKDQTNQWQEVIAIFNDRFSVPFKLYAKNQTEVTLGQDSIIELGFTYVDGNESAELERNNLLKSLSTGEKRALYILNVIFEIETRKKLELKTLIVIDDIADSFDYHNKYAIVQYLKDISEDELFKMIILTHNFDFLRTIQSRFVVDYPFCLMANKNDDGIKLYPAYGLKNIFQKDWKKNFSSDNNKKNCLYSFYSKSY